MHSPLGTCSHSLSRYLAGRTFHESCRISVQWLKTALWHFCFYMSWASTVCLFDFSDQSLVISQKSAAGTKAHLSSQVIIITCQLNYEHSFFLHYDICKTQKKTGFSRSLEPEKKHLQYCTKSSTSSSVSSRRVHFLSQPNDPSGFFWLFFATSALSQEFPEGKWDVTFTDKLIMSKELQQQREATVKAL